MGHIGICNVAQTDILYGLSCAAALGLSFLFMWWPIITFLLLYQGGVQNLLAWSEHLRHMTDHEDLRQAGIMYITSLIMSGPIFTFFSLSTMQSIALIYQAYALKLNALKKVDYYNFLIF